MTNTTPKRNNQFTEYWVMWLADLITIWLAVIVLRISFGGAPFDMASRIVLVLTTVAYIPACWYMSNSKALQRALTLDKAFINSLKAITIHALVFMSSAAFLHLDYSMSFYVSFYLVLCVMFPIINLLSRLWIKNTRRKGRFRTRVAIVGTGTTARRLFHALRKDSGFGYDVIGFFDSDPKPDFKGKYLGDFSELENYVRHNKINEIYFTLVGKQAELMPRLCKIADDAMINFYYVPEISPYVNGSFQLNNVGPIPVMNLRKNPLSITWKRVSKRAFDIAFSSVALFFSPLVFIPIAIGIKLSSPGPVFFRQERTGYRGRSFNCIKFRTMRVNKDADKAQATKDDPRKTRFGDFLRRTNLDELPQFINVWLGDMSVVGPRPHMLKHTNDYTQLIDKYMVRHVVKPGITGWAQVNGYRGITDQLWKMEKRVECDVWYIENWTFSLDLKIIVRTILNTLQGEKNAF